MLKRAVTHKPNRQVDVDVGTVGVRKAGLHRTPAIKTRKFAPKQDLPLAWS